MKPNADEPRVPKSNSGPKPNAMGDLKSLPMPKLQAKLGSSPDGLSQAEAQKRLTQYGPNEIEEKKTNLFLKLLTYFWGPIPWMIEAAVILSAIVRHWADFWIILVLLLMNAVVGFWEEYQAGNAIEALKKKLAQLPQIGIKILISVAKTKKVYTTLLSKSFLQAAVLPAILIQDDAVKSPDVPLVGRYTADVSLPQTASVISHLPP